MTLTEIKCGNKIKDAIWTYNLCAFTQLDETHHCLMRRCLEELLDELIENYNSISEQKLLELFSETTKKLESILNYALLNMAFTNTAALIIFMRTLRQYSALPLNTANML